MDRIVNRRRLGVVAAAVLAIGGLGLNQATAASTTFAGTFSLLGNQNASTAKAYSDGPVVDVGLRFKSSQAGSVSAVRFLKASGSGSSHVVDVWSSDGKLLAKATSTNETDSGWQQVALPSPVAVAAGKSYVVSYETKTYLASSKFFTSRLNSGPLSTSVGRTSVYAYGEGAFPSKSYAASNYWVDVVYSTTAVVGSQPNAGGNDGTTTTTAKPVTTTTAKPATTTTTAKPATTTTTTAPASDAPAPSNGAFPSSANTGVPAGTALKAYDGPMDPSDKSCSIRTDNLVIDSETVNCVGILIYSKNVVFKNSIINSAILTNADSASVTVQDSVVKAGQSNAGAVDGGNITVIRSDISGGQHSVHCGSNCLVQDSYLHDQYNDPSSSPHNNAFISNGGSNIVIRHNTLFCSPAWNEKTGGGCTADLSVFGDFDPVKNVTVDNNLFKATPSGGYCGTFGYNPTKAYGANPSNVVVTNNVFEPGSNGKCGVYGPVTSYLGGSGSQWSNNTWTTGGTVS